MRFEIDHALDEFDTLGLEPLALCAVLGAARLEADLTLRVHHSMPRQLHLFRRESQRTAHQPRTPGKPGKPGDLAVIQHAASRNARHDIPDTAIAVVVVVTGRVRRLAGHSVSSVDSPVRPRVSACAREYH